MPDLFIFGGCNGSGKTTLATKVLDSINPPPEFINADEIAARLNPDDVESVAIEASRLMLKRLNRLQEQKANFVFETTLATRSFVRFLRQCKGKGYRINLVYVWLNSPTLAVRRVAKRVAAGGHNIPHDIIVRRYERGRKNLLELYLPLCDRFQAYDNSQDENSLIAYRLSLANPITIIQQDIWNQIVTY